MPTGWGRQTISGSVNWHTNYSSYSVTPHNNSIRLIYMDSGNNEGQARLYHINTIDLSKYNKVTLTFWMYKDPVLEQFDDRIQVQVKRSGSWVNAGEPISRYASSYGWRQQTVDLSDFGGEKIQIGFLGKGEGGNDLRIDDVSISATWEEPETPPTEPDESDDIVTTEPPTDTDSDAPPADISPTGSGGGGCTTSQLPISALILLIPLVLLGIGRFTRNSR